MLDISISSKENERVKKLIQVEVSSRISADRSRSVPLFQMVTVGIAVIAKVMFYLGLFHISFSFSTSGRSSIIVVAFHG